MRSQTRNTHWLTLTLLVTFAFSPLNSFSQVYKSVDKDGNTSFSDQANPDAKQIEVQPANSAKSVKASNTATSQPREAAAKAYNVRISSPKNDTVIANGLVAFTVNVTLSPALQDGHQLQLSIDGAAHSKSRQKSFTIETLNRGEHRLQVAVIDSKGNIISQSVSIKVFAHRPSTAGTNTQQKPGGPVNLPSRPGINPPKPGGSRSSGR